MIHPLLPTDGAFFKANLHTHTVISDGSHTPEEIKAYYMAHGYSVVAFTDHDVMVSHEELNEDGKFLAITSYEVETNENAPGQPWSKMPCYHLNFYAKNPRETFYPCANPDYTFGNAPKHVQDYYKGDYVRRYSVEGQNEMIAEALAHGFLVSYNHPCWSLQHYPDYAGLAGMTGVEVYNTGCVVGGWVLDGDDHVLDDFLHLGKRVYPLAGDDCHGDVEMCGGWVRLKAPSLTYDNIMTAFEKGDLYASWGPDVSSLIMEDGIVKMTCGNTSRVCLLTDGRHADYREAAPGETLTDVSFDLRGWLSEARRLGITHSAFFRLTLTDPHGGRAMTRGYFADELDDVIL